MRRIAHGVAVVLCHLGVALLGFCVAVAAVAVHRTEATVLGGSVPVGLVLAAAATYAVAWSLCVVPAPSRLATTYAGVWVVTLVVLLRGRPEGDYAVARDAVGYALLLTGVGLVVLGVFVARPRSGRAAD